MAEFNDKTSRMDDHGQVATYFFTQRLADRSSDLLVGHVSQLRLAMRAAMARRPFQIEAIVVLPAAIHTIWTLPPGDTDFAARWRSIKTQFSGAIPTPVARTASQIRRGEKGLWQRRYWEHRIDTDADLRMYRRLIQMAPVHAGLVADPRDWTWTSLHRDLARRHRADNPAPAPRFSKMGLSTVPRRVAAG